MSVANPEIPEPTEETRQYNLSTLERARAAKAAKRQKRLEEEAMTQAKKSTAMANAPFDNEKAQEIASMYETVSLSIMQLINNRWVSLHDNYVTETKNIFTPNAILESLGGGGQFKVLARDTENLGSILMGWTVGINKPPRPPARNAEPIPPFGFDPFSLPTGPTPPPMPLPQVAPQPVPTQLPTAPQDPMQYPPQAPPPGLPPQYRTLPIDQQWAYYNMMQQTQQARTGIDAAAQVALSQVNALQSEKGQLMAALAAKDAALTAATKATDDKLERLERDFQRQLDEAKMARQKAEADAIEARHKADMEARDARHKADMDARDAANREALARITAKLESGGNEKKSEGGFVQYIPLALEWMRMNSSKDEGERNRAMEQQKLMIASMKREPGIEAEAMKHIVELLKSKADEKMANTESQIMMIKTIGDFIKDQQGEEPPVWVGIAQNFVEMLKGGMVGAAAQGVQIPGAPPPQKLEGGEEAPGTTTVVQDDNLSVDERKALVQWQRFKAIDEPAAKMTFMAFDSPKMPPEFQTSEWRLLIFNLHRRMDPVKLAELTANHMEHLLEFGMISPQFRPVFDKPREMLEVVVMALPIAALDKEYATAFLDELVDEIVFRVTEKKRVEKEEAEEEAEEKAAASNGAVVEAEATP